MVWRRSFHATRLFSSFALPGRSHAVPAVFFDYGIPPHGVAPVRFSCCSSSGKAGCREYRKAPLELLRRGFAFDHIKCHRQVWNTWGGRGSQDVRKDIKIERKPPKTAKKCRKNNAVVLWLWRRNFCAAGGVLFSYSGAILGQLKVFSLSTAVQNMLVLHCRS